MKILFISQEYPPETGWGGIATYVHMTAHALASRGHIVHILATGEGQRESHYDDEGVQVHRFGQIENFPFDDRLKYYFPYTADRLITAFSNYSAYRRMRLDCDVIEAPNWKAEALFFLPFAGKPVVTNIVTSLADHVEHSALPPARGHDLRMAAWLEDLCVARSTCVSAATRASLTKGAQSSFADPSRVAIIPHPTRIDAAPPFPAGDAPPNVLFVGRLEPRKNPEVIVRAAASVLKRVPDTRFIFIGKDDRMQKRLLAIAENAGIAQALRFEGYKAESDVVAARLRARVCVVPSRWESFGLVVTEAMAAGRPVVASRIPAFAEILKDGETGRLVDPDDAEEWARAIIEFVSDPRVATVFGDRAREEVRGRFNPELAAVRREALYRRALAEYRSH